MPPISGAEGFVVLPRTIAVLQRRSPQASEWQRRNKQKARRLGVLLGLMLIVSVNLSAQPVVGPPQVIVDSGRADSAFQARVRDLEQAGRRITAGVTSTSVYARKGELDSLFAARTNDGRRSITAEQRLERVELTDSVQRLDLAAATAFRVSVARTILTEMDKGVTFVSFAHRAIDLEQTNHRLHSLWSNENVRNGWDNVNSWGTAIGGVAALAGIAAKGDTRTGIVASGAGLMGVVRLLGDLLGRDRSDRINDVAQQVALSRRAFDALNIRNQELRTYIDANAGFRRKVRAARDTLDAAKFRSDSLLSISRLTPLLTEYATVLSQIPSYINAIAIANNQYASEYPRLAEALAPVTKSAEQLQQSYKEEVLPLLQYSVRLQALLDLDTALSLDTNGRRKAVEERKDISIPKP